MPIESQRDVVIFSGTPGRGSGAERVLEYLLESPTSRTRIAEVIAPADSPVRSVAESLGIAWRNWPVAGDSLRETLSAVLRLRREAPPPGARIFHAWHTRGFEVAAVLSRAWKLLPTGTLHDHPRLRHSQARACLIRAGVHQLQRLAVVSCAMERACRTAGWHVPTVVIPNGLPTLARSPRVFSPPLKVGFTGLNAHWKGIGLLQEIANRTRGLALQWRLYGEPAADVKPIVTNLCASWPERVVHFGYRPAAEIFSEIDLLFHPSLVFDPFPTALLEAARAGVPVLASDVGGSREIVQDQVSGVLFPPNDVLAAETALRKLSASPEQLDGFGSNARARFEQDFSVERMAREYIHFWH